MNNVCFSSHDLPPLCELNLVPFLLLGCLLPPESVQRAVDVHRSISTAVNEVLPCDIFSFVLPCFTFFPSFLCSLSLSLLVRNPTCTLQRPSEDHCLGPSQSPSCRSTTRYGLSVIMFQLFSSMAVVMPRKDNEALWQTKHRTATLRVDKNKNKKANTTQKMRYLNDEISYHTSPAIGK